MKKSSLFISAVLLSLFVITLIAPSKSYAARCNLSKGFPAWLGDFKQRAIGQGISRSTVERALDGITFNPKVIKLDRRQAFFSKSFLEFVRRIVPNNRLSKGRQMLRKHSRLFAKVERTYGVPGPVLVAFWGLETDFGAFMGNMNTIRSLATLAYDCRRPELFQKELMAALKIIERGDLSPREMRGPWAGELGQMQFLPAHYVTYAVDFDGNGRRNLIKSVPDVMASSANYLKSLGWKAGQPWLEEVRVPSSMPWDQADITISHSRSQWSRWGVKYANGKSLRSDGLAASLLLPMGRNGPAFLAYDNFKNVYLEWNHSLVYSTTAGYFATRLAGAKPVRKGNGAVKHLNFAQIKKLQRILAKRGHDVGKIDGIVGAGTRAAVKKEQLKLGLPADSYPTAELISRLR
ncbi:MAG: lytic murein transglycosylase [Pseudomonadota bacterium]